MMIRAERALHIGEEIVIRAREDDDSRTALMGLDRVHKALELNMRALQMIGGDGPTVNLNLGAEAKRVQSFEEALTIVLTEMGSPERERRFLEYARAIRSGIDVPALDVALKVTSIDAELVALLPPAEGSSQ